MKSESKERETHSKFGQRDTCCVGSPESMHFQVNLVRSGLSLRRCLDSSVPAQIFMLGGPWTPLINAACPLLAEEQKDYHSPPALPSALTPSPPPHLLPHLQVWNDSDKMKQFW